MTLINNFIKILEKGGEGLLLEFCAGTDNKINCGFEDCDICPFNVRNYKEFINQLKTKKWEVIKTTNL